MLSLNETVIRNSETPSVLQMVANNPSGRVLAWRFVRANWKTLYARFGEFCYTMITYNLDFLNVNNYITYEYLFDAF